MKAVETAPGDGDLLRRRRRQERLFFRLCTAPALLLTLLVGIVPLGLMVVGSFRDLDSGAWTLRYYLESFSNSFFTRTLLSTMLMAAGVSVSAILLGLPMAYLLARRAFLRNILMPVITVPRMLPFVVVGYAMILLLAPVTGILNRLLIEWRILEQPLYLLFGWGGQALAFGYSAIVVAIGIVTGVLMSVDPQLEDAAVSLGASRSRSFLTVTLPLAMPGIIAASALIFTGTITAYSIPVMLAGRVPYMISIVVATNLLQLQEPHLAYAQAVVVSAIAITATSAAHVLLSRYGRQ